MEIFKVKLFAENDDPNNTLCNGIIISIFKKFREYIYYLTDDITELITFCVSDVC